MYLAGYPQILPWTRDLSGAFTLLKSSKMTVADVVKQMLIHYTSPCVIVVDTYGKRIFATTNLQFGTETGFLVAPYHAGNLSVTPDAQQTAGGRLYSWRTVEEFSWPLFNLRDALTLARKPWHTVEAVVGKIVGEAGDNKHQVIVVDQNARTVNVVLTSGTGQQASESLDVVPSSNWGDSCIALKLAGKVVDGGLF